MIARQIAPEVYAISLGFVNVFLLDVAELTLIDTGVPGSAARIIKAILQIGRQPEDLRHILVTHLHMDHTGSLAELKRITGAQTYMHPLDAEVYSQGEVMRPVEPSPGWITRIIVKRVNAGKREKNPDIAMIDQFLAGDEDLDSTGGIQAIHAPGHTAGHLAYYLPRQSILFAGDAASNLFHLNYSILYEDFRQGQHTLARMAKIGFERACFSHGKEIEKAASAIFQQRFGS